jgi:hypothetical protein
MHIPKRYFHDRTVLLLVTTNTFLTLLCVVMILLRLDVGVADGYIIEYRSNLGLSAFKNGSSATIMSFMLFAVLVLGFHTFLSMRIYEVRRQFSVIVLAFALLLLILTLVISNALLVLR